MSGLRGTLKENGTHTKRSEPKLKQKSEKEQKKKGIKDNRIIDHQFITELSF
jgi:hypothetical protein